MLDHNHDPQEAHVLQQLRVLARSQTSVPSIEDELLSRMPSEQAAAVPPATHAARTALRELLPVPDLAKPKSGPTQPASTGAMETTKEKVIATHETIVKTTSDPTSRKAKLGYGAVILSSVVLASGFVTDFKYHKRAIGALGDEWEDINPLANDADKEEKIKVDYSLLVHQATRPLEKIEFPAETKLAKLQGTGTYEITAFQVHKAKLPRTKKSEANITWNQSHHVTRTRKGTLDLIMTNNAVVDLRAQYDKTKKVNDSKGWSIVAEVNEKGVYTKRHSQTHTDHSADQYVKDSFITPEVVAAQDVSVSHSAANTSVYDPYADSMITNACANTDFGPADNTTVIERAAPALIHKIVEEKIDIAARPIKKTNPKLARILSRLPVEVQIKQQEGITLNSVDVPQPPEIASWFEKDVARVSIDVDGNCKISKKL